MLWWSLLTAVRDWTRLRARCCGVGSADRRQLSEGDEA